MFWKRPKQPRDRFDQMFSYFKYLVSITSASIVLIVAVGTWYLGSNMREVRDNAEKTAISESQKAVEKAFRTENIQEMINKSAEKEIKGAIQVEIAKQMEKVRPNQTDVTTASLVSDAVARMRNFYRSGLTDIMAVLNNPNVDPMMKNSTRTFLRSVARDYEKQVNAADTSLVGRLNMIEVVEGMVRLDIKDPNLKEKLVKIILKDDNLFNVTNATIALRKLTGIPFETFDERAIQSWADRNLKKNNR